MADSKEHQSADMRIPEAYLSTVLTKLMETPKFSDLKFVCEGQEIKVHKAIVCTQSSVIDKSANNEFFVEAHKGRIEMDNFDLPTVKRMVEFMYTGKYSEISHEISKTATLAVEDTGPKAAGEETERTKILEILKIHVRVNAIADYYDIPTLRDVASSKVDGIFARIGFSINIFLDVLKETMGITSDKGLYQVLGSAAANHLEELILNENFRAIDIMKDGFGGSLLFACAQLMTTTRSSLKTERELHQQTRRELATLRDRKRNLGI